MKELSITKHNGTAVLLVWAFFTLQFTGVITALGGVEFHYAALLVIPPMVFELFLVFSVGYVIMGLPRELSFRRRWVTVILVALIVQALFFSVLFFTTRVLDASFGNGVYKAIMHRREVRMVAGGMAWLYTILIIVFSFLQRTVRQTQLAEKRASAQAIAAYTAELKSIKTTINPHFLFNALNVLGTLTIQDPVKARLISFKLSDFMRYSLRLAEKDFSTVADELTHVENYLAIEKIRFGERLDHRIHVEKGLLSAKIPVLTLLPLVENAVKHGIQGCSDGGLITLNIKEQQEHVRIEVKNPVEESPKTLKGEGMGLRTLKRQLTTLYGNRASLKASKHAGVFVVMVKIPLGDGD